MKKTLLPLASIALIATSCVNDDEINVNFDSKTEIRPSASISILSQTRAIEEGTAFAGTNGVYAVTALLPNGTAYIDNLSVNRSGDKYAFPTSQYFPSDGKALDFYAYSPVVADAGTTVTWTLDGEQDILYAAGGNHKKVSAGTTQTQPKFEFSHKLALFNINIKQGTGFSDGIEITSMQVLDVKNNVVLNLKTGELTASGTNPIPVPKVGTDRTDAITSTGALYGRVMLPPSDSYQLLITTTGDITYPAVTLSGADTEGSSLNTYAAGYKYDVTLTFSGTEITPSATITEWVSGGSVAKTVQ